VIFRDKIDYNKRDGERGIIPFSIGSRTFTFYVVASDVNRKNLSLTRDRFFLYVAAI